MRSRGFGRWLLLAAAAGLTAIALTYGAAPNSWTIGLYDIDTASVDTRHILRAVMGLYLAMAALWVVGAIHARYRRTALIALVTFMYGLAAGRLLSLALDGAPSPPLVTYLALEVVLGVAGHVHLLRSHRPPRVVSPSRPSP